jgi:hypothetical protein
MRRRFLAAWACGLAALLDASSTSAQIFKCPGNGGVVLQQTPCPGLGESGGSLMVRANGERVSAAPAPSGPPPAHVLGKTRLPTPKPGNKP